MEIPTFADIGPNSISKEGFTIHSSSVSSWANWPECKRETISLLTCM